METPQNFSRMLVMVNILKSCEPLFWMEALLMVGVFCIDRPTDYDNKKRRKPKTVTTFSEVEPDNPVASFECAHVNVPIIYVRMHKEKSPINMLSCSKAPKIKQIVVTDMQEKPVDFS